jgi:hypothetical protein
METALNWWKCIETTRHLRGFHATSPNTARGCVKTRDDKFGNDSFCDLGNFDESGRRIQWSKNEFSHSLALEPTPRTPCVCREDLRCSDVTFRRGCFGTLGVKRTLMRVLSYILIAIGICLLARASYDECRGVTHCPVTFFRTTSMFTYSGPFNRWYLYSIPVHRDQNPSRFRQFMVIHWIYAVLIEGIGWVLYFRSKR